MHFLVIVAFAMVIWRPEAAALPCYLRSGWAVVSVLVGQTAFIALVAMWISRRCLNSLDKSPAEAHRAQERYHSRSTILRFVLLLLFLASAYGTSWPARVEARSWLQWFYGLTDLLILIPFVVNAVVLWTMLYPADRAIRQLIVESRLWDGGPVHPVWGIGEYLLFNIRTQLLIIAMPMTLILIAYDITNAHRDELYDATQIPWIADILMAFSAGLIFLLAPVMLRFIWSTATLPEGDLRRRLQRLCHRTRLRYRDILIWKSGGMVVNAAVMGLIPSLRYILLSDGLLESMEDENIEAVFGHEAGHVREHHIFFYLLFSILVMIVAGGAMLLVDSLTSLSNAWIQGIGFGLVFLLWVVVFGWISRRFERQADLFGAKCVTPDRQHCVRPCHLHGLPDGPESVARAPASVSPADQRPSHAVCATAAALFGETLATVATLNGISPSERSWRHSSIGSRIAFLQKQAQDPRVAAGFVRLVARIKWALALTTLAALAGCALVIWRMSPYWPG